MQDINLYCEKCEGKWMFYDEHVSTYDDVKLVCPRCHHTYCIMLESIPLYMRNHVMFMIYQSVSRELKDIDKFYPGNTGILKEVQMDRLRQRRKTNHGS